ncbi:MAG: hypothetical protein PHI02_05520 [Sulfurovaceae bacterium]|nr:hypothetical protein [Sulfurovaceae bacterium]
MLPKILLKNAVQSGKEFGWKIKDFEEAVNIAISCNLACLGGQFQWTLSNGTCEAYWLNSDSAKKLESESWSQYVLRSNDEVFSGFNIILSSVDFEIESNKFEFLKLENQKGINISNYLIFVAYFVNQCEII